MKYSSYKIKFDDEIASDYLANILRNAIYRYSKFWSGWQFGNGPRSWDEPILIKRVFDSAIFQELVF